MRDDQLRAFGFFDTPIKLSFYLNILSIFFFLSFLYLKNSLFRIATLVILIINFIGIYLTQTRAGILGLFIGLFSLLFYKNYKKIRFIYLPPFILAIFTFISFTFLWHTDLSIQGRIKQHLILLEENFFLKAYGLGNVGPKYGIISADSNILNSIFTFNAIGALFYMFIFILVINELSEIYLKNLGKKGIYIKPEVKIITETSIALSSAIIYWSFFHNFIGSFIMYIWTILIGISINKLLITYRRYMQ